jgi:hypothetical protein
MKKSEMQSLVANMLQLYRFDNVNDMEAANRLLLALEQEGMLPPPSSFNIHNVDKQLGFVAEVTYDFPINEDNSVNLWEPEE